MFSWYKEEEEEKEVVTVRVQWVWTGTEDVVKERGRYVCSNVFLIIFLFVHTFFFKKKIICKLLPG